MPTIVHAGGGNPAIAEVWMSSGYYTYSATSNSADCNDRYYSVSEGDKNKLSAMDFPRTWSDQSGTPAISFTPNVDKIHCVILPYCQPAKVSIVSSTAEYEKISDYKSINYRFPNYTPVDGANGFELIFKNMTIGKSYSITLSLSIQAILGIIMIIYDD